MPQPSLTQDQANEVRTQVLAEVELPVVSCAGQGSIRRSPTGGEMCLGEGSVPASAALENAIRGLTPCALEN